MKVSGCSKMDMDDFRPVTTGSNYTLTDWLWVVSGVSALFWGLQMVSVGWL